MMSYFTKNQWFSLSLKLRQKWWKETDFSKEKPSLELLEEVLNELDKVEKDK